MRTLIPGTLALSLLLGATGVGYAKCGDNPGDAAAVAAARQAVEDECNCAGAPNHGQYVKCAAGVANARAKADPSLLPTSCKGQVKKCAAKSTCGKPGFVTCCVTKNSATKCKLKKSETACTDKGGLVGACTSCCDACPAPGSGPSCSPSGAFLDPIGF